MKSHGTSILLFLEENNGTYCYIIFISVKR